MNLTESHELMQDFPEMKILVDVIDKLPSCYQERFQLPAQEVLQTLNRRMRVARLVHEAFQDVRLDIKYLQFDLDATRQERDEFHRRLTSNDSQ